MEIDLPPFDDIFSKASVVSLPLNLPFRGTSVREVMLLTGNARVGEWAAFPEYSDEVAARWLAAAIEQAYASGFSVAHLSSKPISVNATFPALPPDQIPDWWKKFSGARTAKVKVAEPAGNLMADYKRVEAARNTFGEAVRLRLDANGLWSLDQAEKAMVELSKFSIDYVEQPVATLSEMVELKKRLQGSGIQLAVDELVRESNGLEEIISSGAADVAVLKASPLAGIGSTLELARTAHAAGLDVVLSSALETSVGLSWGIRAAALIRQELGSLPDAGLGTSVFFTQDVVVNPIQVIDGAVGVFEPEIDDNQLQKLAASLERRHWWRERLQRCLPLAVDILKSRKSHGF